VDFSDLPFFLVSVVSAQVQVFRPQCHFLDTQWEFLAAPRLCPQRIEVLERHAYGTPEDGLSNGIFGRPSSVMACTTPW